jgi:hypothetical protein
MLTRLGGDREELADLLASAGEEASPVDRSRRTKRLAHEPEAIEDLRFLQPGRGGPRVVHGTGIAPVR